MSMIGMRHRSVFLRAILFFGVFLCQFNVGLDVLYSQRVLANDKDVVLRKSARHGSRNTTTNTTSPTFRVPQWLFAGLGTPVKTGFMRVWRVSGPQLCQSLREKGVPVSEWQPAAFGQSKIYECVYEAANEAQGEYSAQALFLIVRGEAGGSIAGVRAKLSLEATGSQMHLSPEIAGALHRLLTVQNWFDPTDILSGIERFKEVKREGFGASIIFSPEKTNPSQFNLRITAQNEGVSPAKINELHSVLTEP
ncbi:DUF6030 family protein [Shinella sp.]|uniref:DUF6030 family protein n=1 Tax=Shinella sp. TaxID=1870904 RepID=UPI00289CC369|nr:DUF6030 family protein [Shinella sp.]